MESKMYKIRVVRGAFINPEILDKLCAKCIEKFDRDEWIGIDEVIINYEQIKELQKQMVKHYDDTKVPWYMDGYGTEDKDDIVVAFGADDGEGGKIFEFNRKDGETVDATIKYAISKGIPKEQLNFLEIDF